MPTRITFNGKQYDRPEDMPPAIRAAYESAIGLYRQSGSTPAVNIKIANVSFVHDGKTYNSLDELPPELRQKYEIAMGQLDKNQNGIPDMLEGAASSTSLPAAQGGPSPAFDMPAAPIAPVSPQPSVIQQDRPNRSLVFIVLVAGLVFFLLLAVSILLFYAAAH